MLPLYTTVVILLVIGILSIIEFDAHAFWQYLMRRGDRQSLKDDVTILAGDIPKGFFKRQNYETAMILKSTGRENSFQVVRVISMIAAVVGIVVAMLLDNIFLIPVFGIVFWLIPRLYVISSASLHKKHLNEELETTMSILWQDIDLDIKDWIDDLREEYPDLGEDELIQKMYEINAEYLGDERDNLNIQCGSEIIVFGDIGRWNGRVCGYKIIESGNIRDCLYSDCDMNEWYVDRNGDLCSTQIHHDGRNYLYYREITKFLNYGGINHGKYSTYNNR